MRAALSDAAAPRTCLQQHRTHDAPSTQLLAAPGAGNTPAVIDETANVNLAVSSILLSKTFDNGVICSTEQSVIVVDSMCAARGRIQAYPLPCSLPRPALRDCCPPRTSKLARRRRSPPVGVHTCTTSQAPDSCRPHPSHTRPNSHQCHPPRYDAIKEEFKRRGAYFLNEEVRLGRVAPEPGCCLRSCLPAACVGCQQHSHPTRPACQQPQPPPHVLLPRHNPRASTSTPCLPRPPALSPTARPQEKNKVRAKMFIDGRLNPDMVGQSAYGLGKLFGVNVAKKYKVRAQPGRAGRGAPLRGAAAGSAPERGCACTCLSTCSHCIPLACEPQLASPTLLAPAGTPMLPLTRPPATPTCNRC